MKSLFAAAMLGAAVGAAAWSSGASAQLLRIGLSSPVSSLDPHFYSITPNNSAAFHIYDRLVHRLPDGPLAPGLALSWRAISDTQWEFSLRPGATWHDGRPFTAEDVAFSLERARNVPNSLGGFENLVRPIVAIDVADATTIRVTTSGPVPNLP